MNTVNRKNKRLEERAFNVELFKKDNENLWMYLGWNIRNFKCGNLKDSWVFEFCESLVEYIRKNGALSDKQLAALLRIKEAKGNSCAKVKPTPTAIVDLTVIKDKLLLADAKNLKAKIIAGDGYKFTLAPSSGKNPNCVYVAFNGEYLGKINSDGEFFGYKVAKEHLDNIQAIAQNPLQEVKAYGLKSGRCGCCSRQLTNKESIKLGIGPICRENYGL